MRILTEQKRGHSPFAYSDLQDTSQTAWFIMQDIRPADEAYWKHITTKISVDHFEKKCASDNHFAGQYSRVLPKLRKTAERFATDMADLYRDGTSVTVTHGDLQDMVGDHVRCFQGRPMIIDWGFSRLAPFYIDLVDYFTQEEALLYLYICIRRWLNTSVGTGIS